MDQRETTNSREDEPRQRDTDVSASLDQSFIANELDINVSPYSSRYYTEIMQIDRQYFNSSWSSLSANEFSRRLRSNHFRLIVATSENNIAGFALCKVLGPQIEINRLFINHFASKKKIATSILEATKNILGQVRRTICMQIDELEEELLSLFKENGFEAQSVLKNIYQNPDRDGYLFVYENQSHASGLDTRNTLRLNSRWFEALDADEAFVIDKENSSCPWSYQDFMNFIQAEENVGFASLCEDRLVGFALTEYSENRIHIPKFGVAADLKDHGIHQKIIDDLILKLNPQPNRNLTVEVAEHDTTFQLLLKEKGFYATNILKKGDENSQDTFYLMTYHF